MRSGFINLYGLPNAGKSTIFNQLSHLKLAGITPKAQTTINRIKAILNKPETYQIILSDLPGFLEIKNSLHNKMLKLIEASFADLDVALFIFDPLQDFNLQLKYISLIPPDINKIIGFSKTDLLSKLDLGEIKNRLKETYNSTTMVNFPLHSDKQIEQFLNELSLLLPVHHNYFPMDESVSDLPLRFFVAEIIREKLLLQYHQEIPYQVFIKITEFTEQDNITKIKATLFTSKKGHEKILVGYKGEQIKNLGIKSREEIEKLLDKKVYLQLEIKTKENWIENESLLTSIVY